MRGGEGQNESGKQDHGSARFQGDDNESDDVIALFYTRTSSPHPVFEANGVLKRRNKTGTAVHDQRRLLWLCHSPLCLSLATLLRVSRDCLAPLDSPSDALSVSPLLSSPRSCRFPLFSSCCRRWPPAAVTPPASLCRRLLRPRVLPHTSSHSAPAAADRFCLARAARLLLTILPLRQTSGPRSSAPALPGGAGRWGPALGGDRGWRGGLLLSPGMTIHIVCLE